MMPETLLTPALILTLGFAAHSVFVCLNRAMDLGKAWHNSRETKSLRHLWNEETSDQPLAPLLPVLVLGPIAFSGLVAIIIVLTGVLLGLGIGNV